MMVQACPEHEVRNELKLIRATGSTCKSLRRPGSWRCTVVAVFPTLISKQRLEVVLVLSTYRNRYVHLFT